ncbi:MAG: hypothetical protein EWV45_22810 [Microcystis flos-aquae Mf_QC_C_20070823_S10D]|uniref:Uncharacterized protein n=1 Tax=Microcystis flos-aquae Mf_QC_C_20070823_S10D TaxID=2486236 RepID=A0A552KDW6_9CHRO|nr:MAG: hypothetical protein EWV65_21605 [Microcystis flos-aquae Ma_QC_C_20070823_S18D]TRV06176.1 MAG: hypothetical protein EWV45_22810 [Microcystis flos-aquae Mf_QC_C_20070823_S10D]TRV25219.1 MAG: hypothetical protein EWV72_10060 [Microcystis flos-aquae Mf_QC_C_20070823_S10]TRV33762.1 MAG: hypothetical protein EWV70_12980 [Microcystis flos-aquae Mf_QC_C_20070823_S20]TRV35280.1 MAG: hypothetical protein EWV71_13060 [Microcystis flos-aquae Mf_QC_C_20070823_S20D]TRV42481.1 MAG: hypothetical prot
MRNVNLNILKFLRSINNFYLSLSKIGLEVRSQESGDYFYLLSPHPTPHTPLPTPHTPHPTPHTPHPTPYFLISFSNDCHRFFQSNK